MRNSELEYLYNEIAKKCVYFYDFSLVSRVLEDLLHNVSNRKFSLIDLGCGDGTLLYVMHSKGLLKNAERVVGVDISEERIDRLKKFCTFVEGIVADVCNLKEIPDNSFDVVVSNQVIEHVLDDLKMLNEIYRILKPNGYFYISTVIKKRHGFWIYWKNGFKLDPTHVREYRSSGEFLNKLTKCGFKVIYWKERDIYYPIIDLIIRVLINMKLIKPQPDFYLKHSLLLKMRKLKFKVVGYKIIEVVGKVKK